MLGGYDPNDAETGERTQQVKIQIRRVRLSDTDQKELRTAARTSAARVGLSPDEWERLRKVGNPILNDALMATDPDCFLRGRDD